MITCNYLHSLLFLCGCVILHQLFLDNVIVFVAVTDADMEKIYKGTLALFSLHSLHLPITRNLTNSYLSFKCILFPALL